MSRNAGHFITEKDRDLAPFHFNCAGKTAFPLGTKLEMALNSPELEKRGGARLVGFVYEGFRFDPGGEIPGRKRTCAFRSWRAKWTFLHCAEPFNFNCQGQVEMSYFLPNRNVLF
jgi:hypothetical protein